MNNTVLILTLIIDGEAQNFFNILRQRYFPAERNYLDAHLTLFHHLPGNEPIITEVIKNACDNANVFELNIVKIVSIGNGVAYKIESSELQQIHKEFQQQFSKWLTPQDKQTLWPHITVQNKTSATVANQLIKDLNVNFNPFKASALGFKLWEYKNGPWEFIDEFKFKR